MMQWQKGSTSQALAGGRGRERALPGWYPHGCRCSDADAAAGCRLVSCSSSRVWLTQHACCQAARLHSSREKLHCAASEHLVCAGCLRRALQSACCEMGRRSMAKAREPYLGPSWAGLVGAAGLAALNTGCPCGAKEGGAAPAGGRATLQCTVALPELPPRWYSSLRPEVSSSPPAGMVGVRLSKKRIPVSSGKRNNRRSLSELPFCSRAEDYTGVSARCVKVPTAQGDLTASSLQHGRSLNVS